MPDEVAPMGADATRAGRTTRNPVPGRRLRVCLVKQHTTYDLYTKTGPDLLTIVSSSNWRSGPIGLWEAFDCDFRIVYEMPDRECQIGKPHWAEYVEDWDIWPQGSRAEHAENVDWGAYDIVISVDMAIPTRIIREHPQTMWCYYFIEFGTTSIDSIFRGSPYFGCNVFFTQRPARTILNRDSSAVAHMLSERRAILDFPYHMMSSTSIQNLYEPIDGVVRKGTMMNSHSLEAISAAERHSLGSLNQINDGGVGLVNVHRDGLRSEYCVVHPRTRPITGVALVEAISAGCVALAPRQLVVGVGFKELLCEQLDYSDFAGLLRVVERLQNDKGLYSQVLAHQSQFVDEFFFSNPARNLESLLAAFRESDASFRRQTWSERRDRAVSNTLNLGARIRRRAVRDVKRVWGADDPEGSEHA